MKDAWPELVEGKDEGVAALRQAQGTAQTQHFLYSALPLLEKL